MPASAIRTEAVRAGILSRVIQFQATTQLTGDMLVKVDRMSMAHSIEVRCPLLDHKLAEFAMRIPFAWNMKNGRGKQLLRAALADRLPSELLRLPKKGFASPTGKLVPRIAAQFPAGSSHQPLFPDSRHCL